MADQNTPAPAAGITQEAHEAAVNAARAEGHKAGATEATARIGAILNSEEAKANQPLAAHFAFNTSMTPDDAKAALKIAGPAASAPASTDIAARQAGLAQFGADPAAQVGVEDRSRAGWASAVKNANQSIGAVAR